MHKHCPQVSLIVIIVCSNKKKLLLTYYWIFIIIWQWRTLLYILILLFNASWIGCSPDKSVSSFSPPDHMSSLLKLFFQFLLRNCFFYQFFTWKSKFVCNSQSRISWTSFRFVILGHKLGQQCWMKVYALIFQ